MLNFDFVLDTHEEFGSVGLRPKWMRDGDPLSGMAVAHDCLEHVPETCKVGYAEGEFMALGVSVWLRAGGGYWHLIGNWNRDEDHIAADIPDILGRVESGEQTLDDPGRTTKLDEEWAEEIIEAAINIAAREMRARDREMKITDDVRTRIRGWMRRGFRAGQKRYAKYPGGACQMAHLFHQIEKKADSIIKYDGECYQGATVKVKIDLRKQKFKMYTEEPEYG